MRVAVLLVIVCAGCAERNAYDAEPSSCAANGSTLAFLVTPDVLLRGSSELVALSWELTTEVASASAQLETHGEEVISLVVPLVAMEGADGYAYGAEIENPFGSGAPVGSLDIIASGQSSGCRDTATAATSISLE